jgi:hypothetical protein
MKAAVARAAYPGAELIGPVRLASRMGSGWRLQTHEGSPSAAASLPESVEDRPLMAGIHGLRELRPGLHLHVTDIVHLCDLHTVCRLEDIGFKILLRLEGSARVVIDGVELPLVAGSGAAARPVGLLLGLAAPVQFERRSQRGVQERMVVLTLGMDWLRQAGLDAAQCSRHLSLHAWRAVHACYCHRRAVDTPAPR